MLLCYVFPFRLRIIVSMNLLTLLHLIIIFHGFYQLLKTQTFGSAEALI